MNTANSKAREVQMEWRDFVAAIQKPQPAIETFTAEALMLLHLLMGADALKKTQ
jgi:hypothetical protein